MECISSARANAAGTEAAGAQTGRPGSEPQVMLTEGAKMTNKSAQSDLEAQPESQPVLMAEVRYGVVFGELNELFYGRLHRLLLAVSIFAAILIAGGGVGTVIAKEAANLGLADFLKQVTFWSLLAGAVSESVRRAFKFDQREAAFRKAKEEFQELEGKGWSMALGTLQRELAKLRKNAPAGGEWLASSAFNKACQELGHPERHRHVPAPVEWIRMVMAS